MSAAIYLLNEATSSYEVVTHLEPTSFCKLAMGKTKRPILTMIWKYIQRFGSVPSSCPIRKGHYYINDFDVDESFIPALTPPGAYKLDIIFTIADDLGTNKIIHKLIVFGGVDQSIATDDSESSQEQWGAKWHKSS